MIKTMKQLEKALPEGWTITKDSYSNPRKSGRMRLSDKTTRYTKYEIYDNGQYVCTKYADNTVASIIDYLAHLVTLKAHQ